MIPTLILLGAVLGHWWRVVLVAAALGWPALLLGTGASGLEWGLVVGSGLAVANAGLGVLVHRTVAPLARRLRGAAG
ncbi:hypothetical protein [Plantactinospora sp. CA-290183]|uniref:hypothetical protein n=1 Tax=Plantactinospora sp. CA-290183 TaxID=3240006 RepID=UPI003D8A914F